MSVNNYEFNSEYCRVTYMEEENIVFLEWKKFCFGDNYRKPTLHALSLLEKFKGSNFLFDARNGFEDEKEDVEWGFNTLLPAMAKTSCENVVFIMNQASHIEEEMNMWEKEFRKYFNVEKFSSMEDAINYLK